MANVIVRNLDDEVVERLRARAKTNSRSLEAELRVLLTNAVRRHRPKDLIELADRIAAMTPNVPQTDSTLLVREDRDR